MREDKGKGKGRWSIYSRVLSGSVLFHLLLVLVLAFLLFPRRPELLFNGLDGDYMRILIQDQWSWMETGNLGFNVMQGGTTGFLPTDFTMIPALALQNLLFGGIDPITTFALFSVQLFGAAFLWARLCRIPVHVALAGAWVTLAAMPFLPWYLQNAIFHMDPHIADLVFGLVLYLLAVRGVGETTGWSRLFPLAGIVLIPSYLAVSNPLVVVILGPVLVLGTFGLVALAVDWRARAWQVMSLFSSLLVALVGGVVAHVYGLLDYSAVRSFSGEFERFHSTLFSASIAFQHPTYPLGRYLVILGTAGALMTIWKGENRQTRAFALLHLGMSLVVTGGAALIVKLVPEYDGPTLYYFEIPLWSSYAVFAVQALVLGSAWANEMVFGILVGRSRPSAVDAQPAALDRTPALVLLIPLFGAVVGMRSGSQAVPRAYPPRPTPITDYLVREASQRPGRVFQGYVATFTGPRNEKKGLGWMDQHAFDHQVLVSRYGNDHRFVGLWYFAIPTLNEYSPLISPFLYLVTSRFLARPGDRHNRNIILLSQANVGLLRALGVRFVIADHRIEGAVERVRIPIDKGNHLFLWELPRPNLGTYSPTQVLVAGNAATALEQLASLDLERAVVLERRIEGKLVRISTSRVEVGPNQIRVSARSQGKSLLVIPIQFSRCIASRFPGPPAAHFEMIRANLVQTGLVFGDSLDVTLSLEVNPFSRTRRTADSADARRLDVSGAAKRYPPGWGARPQPARRR